MVVDVAIEGCNQIRRPEGRLQFLRVHRVRIRLRDDADARPPRVSEYRDTSALLADEEAQQIICDHCRAHRPCVVTEFANFSCGLVHERPCATRCTHAHRARREQRIVLATDEQWRNSRIGCFETVAPHHHVDACGITTSHFHAVECGECLLDGEVRVARGVRRPGASEVEDGDCIAQTVVANRPVRILQPGEIEAAPLHLGHAQ